MNAPTKLGGFALAMAALFGIAAAFGNLAGPIDTDGDSEHDDSHAGGDSGHDMAGMDDDAEAASAPGGLTTSQDGYTLELDRDSLSPGTATPLSFRITDDDGHPLTTYTKTHDKDLHLIAVRRDLSGFQHVHPRLDDEGTWATSLDLDPGSWRIFADFDPAGADAPLTLGTDLSVPGQYVPTDLPEPTTKTTVDGYTVSLDGDLESGVESVLTLLVAKDGKPVTDLQPYLAAYGHLVALRDGDLAYLHVHPDGSPGDGETPSGPDIAFHTTAPSQGAYRLYLDFKHDGVVRTAEFTVQVGEDSMNADESATHEGDDHAHED